VDYVVWCWYTNPEEVQKVSNLEGGGYGRCTVKELYCSEGSAILVN
jgi:hypothetical protein